MRKMLLSTLVCVAFASSAFASNEIVVENEDVKTNAKLSSTFEIQSVNYEFGFCSITIIYHYILPGGQTYSETKTIMLGYTQNAAQCQQLQRDYVNKVLLPSLQPGDKVW